MNNLGHKCVCARTAGVSSEVGSEPAGGGNIVSSLPPNSDFHVKFTGEVPRRVSDPVGKNKLKAIIIIVLIIIRHME